MAESLTDKIKLSKRDTGDLNWGQGANANLDALDAHVQQATLRPPRTLLATLGSGAVGANLLGSTSYFYKVTATNAAGETTEGKIPATVEAQVTEPASPLPVILQWETVKGATGYKIYKSAASGQEKFLASVSGEATSVYTDDGNTAVNGALSVPAANTARAAVSKIVAGTNVTISPPDGTGDVTINAAGGTVPDASDTVKGIAKLSVAPAIPTNPVAVGDNDPRNANARTPTGAAGGDLSGTYPNPGVAKVNGVSVPASPSAGQVLTATSPTAAAWQTPAGGGGYATAVVAAPTGVAATDTANIQSAFAAITTAGGGTVVLREGTYVVNATLTPGAKTTIKGQGKAATVIQAASTMGNLTLFNGGNGHVCVCDLTLDANGAARGANGTVNDIVMGGDNPRMSNVKMINPFVFNTTTYFLSFTSSAGGNFDGKGSGFMENCEVITDGGVFRSVKLGAIAGNPVSTYFGIAVINNVFSTTSAGNDFIILGDCQFIGNTIHLNPSGGGNGSGSIINVANGAHAFISGNYFHHNGSSTYAHAIAVTGGGSFQARVSIAGNVADFVNAGDIASLGPQALITAVGNIGFNGYTGTGLTSIGNDGAATVNQSLADAKGDLIVASANDAFTRLPVGADGQVLTADTAQSAGVKWATPAGGGGYATVLVAAPTGVAATDTANIQNAISSLPAAGGAVVLREGTYAINAQILLPSGKPVWIVGQGRATVLADAPSVFMLGIFKGPASGNISGLALSDFLVDGTNSGSGVLELSPTGTQVFENIKILRVHGNRSSRHLHANPAAGTTIKSVEVSGCETNLGDKLVLMLGSGTIQRFTIRDNKTFNDINKVDSVLWLRGDQHVIEGNQFYLQAGTIGEGAIAIRDSMERCVIHGNLVRYQGLLAFVGFTPAGAVFRHNVVGDNVNHDVDPLILKSIVLTGKGEVSNNIITGNKLDLLIDLPTSGPSGNNVVVANKASSIQGGTSSDVIAATFLSGLRKLGEASPLTGDVKLEAGSGISLTQDPPNNKITISGGGAWVKVADQAPADNNSFPLLSGLNLSTDRVWRITLQWINPTLNDTQIKLILNGAGTSEYGWQELKVDGTGISAQRVIGSGVGVIAFCKGGGGSGNFDIILQPAGVAGSDAYGGCMAHSRGQTATRGFPQPPIMYQYGLVFELIAAITSVQIAAVTPGTLGANSRLQLLRMA